MNKSSKIYIAGHRGLVGSAILKKLTEEGYKNIVYRTSEELDLRDMKSVSDFFNEERPEYVFFTAAKAGGVLALNTYKVESMEDNIRMQCNVFGASYFQGAKKLIFIGSNCMYPKLAVEPLKEEYIGAGKLEPTTEFYATAKIAGLKMCQAYNEQHSTDFITAIPVNLYGQGDKNDLKTAHVMPALLRKFKEAKESKAPSVEIWGTGAAYREFMHAEDFADACLFLMNTYTGSQPVNVGSGYNTSIKDLADSMKKITGYKGEIVFNAKKPDGIKSKLLDSSVIYDLGWKPSIELEAGITEVYNSL